MKKAIPFVIVLGLIAIIFGVKLLRPAKPEAIPTAVKTSETFAMGSVCRITAFFPVGEDEKAKTATDTAFAAVHAVDEACSLYSDMSDISRVNAGGPSFDGRVGGDFFACLQVALDMNGRTNGLFNPAIGPLMSLWGFGAKSTGKRVPSADEIASVLPLLDISGVLLGPQGKTVRLRQVGMSLDLNGIAQGFASERAAEALVRLGVSSALIESGGGEFVAIGSKPGNEAFRIGIRKPRRESPEVIAYVEMRDKALATSGDYEKYFEADGKRYSHLMDPRTGMPKTGEPSSVTVIGKSCAICDALATVAAILSPEEAKRVVATFPGYEVIIATETPGGPKFTYSDGLEQTGDTFSFRK